MPSATELNQSSDEHDSGADDHGNDPAITADPSLAALVPQSSPRRAAVLVVAAVALLAIAWWAAPTFRPTLAEDIDVGSWSAVSATHQVVTTALIRSDGSRSLRSDSVGSVPGAQVAGAWLVPTAELAVEDPDREYPDGMAQIHAHFPNDRFDASTALPQPTPTDRESTLVVLWDIIDCSALDDAVSPTVAISAAATRVLRTHRRVDLPDFFSPAAHLDTLVDTGICPAASVSGSLSQR